MSTPFAYDLVIDGVDICRELSPMAASLGMVRISAKALGTVLRRGFVTE